MQKIWMYIIAHFGAKCTFLRKNALLAPEKKRRKSLDTKPLVARFGGIRRTKSTFHGGSGDALF